MNIPLSTTLRGWSRAMVCGTVWTVLGSWSSPWMSSRRSIRVADGFPIGPRGYGHGHRPTRPVVGSSPLAYDTFDGVLERVDVVAEASVLLRVGVPVPPPSEQRPSLPEYHPGHVLALEMEVDDVVSSSWENPKNRKDVTDHGGWMRGPYTVSRSSSSVSDHDNPNDRPASSPYWFDVLIQTVGDKSRAMASAPVGTAVRFGGRFKVPIWEGVTATDDTDIDRVVFLSTGVGVGPCWGAIEQAVAQPFRGKGHRRLELYASYETEAHVAFRDELDRWLGTNHQVRVGGKFSDEAHVDAVFDTYTSSSSSGWESHYHLIGDGAVVNEWREGLLRGGVAPERITHEIYFHHRADGDPDAVARIAEACRRAVPSLPS